MPEAKPLEGHQPESIHNTLDVAWRTLFSYSATECAAWKEP